MSLRSDELATEPTNPFATRFIRPGAVAYVFDEGQSTRALIERLRSLKWRAQIIGRHGSGKSTLLAQLTPALERAGQHPAVFVLQDGQRRLPNDWLIEARRICARMIIVDGYEQLSRASRFWLKCRCRREGLGLLVTAHQAVGFETLVCTKSTLSIAQEVVAHLLRNAGTAIDPEAVARCFVASKGNIRETLFALYDHFERPAGQ